MEEEVGFQVTDEVVVGDLTAVQQQLKPICQNVLVEIEGGKVQVSKDKASKALILDFRMVEGIPTEEDGETRMKYVGAKFSNGFMDLLVWADPAVKTSNWYKQQTYLLPFKSLKKALSIDVKEEVRINDEWLSSLKGRQIRLSIRHEEEQALDQTTGKYVNTGSLKERIGSFKKAE